jgi:ABC-2 type transport system permease protein
VRLLYAELLKVRTAPRTTLGLVLGLLLLVGLGSAATASDANSSPFASEMAPWDVIRVASFGSIFTLILGILVVTWEYRHGTITQTYLAIPKRERVIGAKLVVSLLLGAILVALAIAVALVVARFWISLEITRGLSELAGRTVLAAALWGALGAGVGALIQSQVGAIVTAFVWFLVAEPLFGFSVDAVTDSAITDYLPGSVIDRLESTGQPGESLDGSTPEYPYGLWVAGLLASAYVAAFAVLGIASAVRRDVP